MDIASVTTILVQLHQNIQAKSGFDPSTVKATSCPLKDLPGFDSMLVPVVFRRLASALGIALPTDFRVPNIYVGADGKQRRSIAEVAAAFCTRFSAKAA